MPRYYWITIPAVLFFAIWVRLVFQKDPDAVAPEKKAPIADALASPPFKQVEEAALGNAEEPSGPDLDDTPRVKGPLTFDQEPIELNPKPEDEEVTTTFTFTNTSGKPVTIHRLESTCSCLEASLDQRTYAPGAKGTGKAVFKVSSFVGRHEKTLHLYTDDPSAPEQVVTFVLDVPVVVSIEPNFVEWALGDLPTPKQMTFKMLGDNPIRITKITPTRENVRFDLKEVSPGREYVLTLTPVSTADITMGGLKIETDSKIPKYARQMAFFAISRPELVEKRKQEDEEKRRKEEGEKKERTQP